MKNIKNNIKLFKGHIFHKRYGKIEHSFKNKIVSIFINLTSLSNGELITSPLLFSINRFNIFSWRSSNHGLRIKDSKPIDLEKFIKDLINEKNEKDGQYINNIKLLTFPKVIGFVFSPLSVYLCYNKFNQLVHAVFEVKNTFGDIHHYILKNIPQKGNAQKVLKKMFVSPFYNTKGSYVLNVMYQNNKIETSVQYEMNKKLIFSASMNLKEIDFNNINIMSNILNLSLFPGKIWINIHYEAVKLWLKKVSLYKIPPSLLIKKTSAIGLIKNKK
jgi:DUF1365 family protein